MQSKKKEICFDDFTEFHEESSGELIRKELSE